MSIEKFKKYIDLLDEVYKAASLTARLDVDGALVRAGANANEICIPKMTMDGLADYSRTGGYVTGAVNLESETVTFNYDRGRKFTVDAMDNEETAGVAFGKLSAEFIRTKVIPELDAFRFATYAGTSNILTTDAAALSTGALAIAAVSAAASAMDDQEVPTEGRVLYVTPTLKRLIDDLDTTKSRAVMDSFAAVVTVPQGRFYTAIDLLDGTSQDETAGGYAKASGAKNINFMIVHPSAVLQYGKHTVNKVITPEANQNSDGWMFFYRAYGLADVYDNKVKGVYLHKSTT